MATFEEILNSLLEGLEKDPQADVNELAVQTAAELGLKCDTSMVKEVNGTVESIDSKYLELIKAKEETGVSTQTWLRRSIMKTASDHNVNEEQQIALLESLAENAEKEICDNLDKMN